MTWSESTHHVHQACGHQLGLDPLDDLLTLLRQTKRTWAVIVPGHWIHCWEHSNARAPLLSTCKDVFISVKHPSVTDQVKPNPVDFSLYPMKILPPSPRYLMKSITSPGRFVASPIGLSSIFPAHIIWKSQNSVLTERGNLVENLPTRWRLFRKPSENIDATGSITEGCV